MSEPTAVDWEKLLGMFETWTYEAGMGNGVDESQLVDIVGEWLRGVGRDHILETMKMVGLVSDGSG